MRKYRSSWRNDGNVGEEEKGIAVAWVKKSRAAIYKKTKEEKEEVEKQT